MWLVEFTFYFRYFVLAIVAFSCLGTILRARDEQSSESITPSGISLAVVFLSTVLLIAVWPDELSSDKGNYRNGFEMALLGLRDFQSRDILWAFWMRVCSWLRMTSDVFFFATSLVFCSNFLIAGRRIFRRQYAFFFFAVIVSLGFFSYGVNTMRAGLALSFLVLGLSFYPNKLKMALLAFVAVGLHKSLIIPISAFLVSLMIPKSKFLFAGWVGCLVLSLLFGNQIQTLIGEFFAESEDARATNYLLGESDLYRQGFRWDFIAYSLIPIVVGFWLRKKQFFEDRFFNLLLGTYIVANGFWLLVIRIPYSDRVAYLSWVLFPMVILYPLLKYPRSIPNSRFLAVAAIFCMGAITIGLSLIRAGMR